MVKCDLLILSITDYTRAMSWQCIQNPEISDTLLSDLVSFPGQHISIRYSKYFSKLISSNVYHSHFKREWFDLINSANYPLILQVFEADICT